MQRSMKWWKSAGLALTAMLAFGAGCAQDVGDIDRTQPDKLLKSTFKTDDEWFYRQTVVKTDMQGSVIFAGLESDLKRIRWEVTEKTLYAYSTVDLADGLTEGIEDQDKLRLGAVAAFPITSHFDVRRSYNSATGEQSNVIEENSYDRPWYEREYMRVDWSNNIVDGRGMFQNYLGMTSVASIRSPEYQGKVDPNRLRMSENYIDTVTEFNYEPDVMQCYSAYGLDTIFSCDAGRVSVRSSFLKADPVGSKYQAFNYTDTVEIPGKDNGILLTKQVYDQGFLFEAECDQHAENFFNSKYGSTTANECAPASYDLFSRFGYFRTERVVWDPGVGTSDTQRRYYANRWNIWQSMFDENGKLLDAKNRIPKPITYHLNLEYPASMFDAAQVVAKDWNKTFRGAVKLAMGITDAKLDEILEAEYGHTNMYQIVENSCHPGPLVQWKTNHGATKDADRSNISEIFASYAGEGEGAELEKALWKLSNARRTDLCAELEYATERRGKESERFSWERVGDLRYSFFNWVETDVPWAGYGPSAADPLSGELISGNANFAGSYIRRSATYAADLIQFFNGDLDRDDIRYGNQIKKDLLERAAGRRSSALSIEGKEEMARRAGVTASSGKAPNFSTTPEADELDPFIMRHGVKKVMAEAGRISRFGKEAKRMDTRRTEFLDQPRVKQLLLRDPEMMMAVKAHALERFGPNYDEHATHQAYLELFDPALSYGRYQARNRFLSDRNILSNEAIERSMETLVTYRGVADFFRGKPRQEIIDYFLNKMFIGTQLHEVGHTVGLRHNFAASTDALNYHDEYWMIERAVADGLLTPDEVHSIPRDKAKEILGLDVDYVSQDEFRLASVMDYTGDLTGRFAGLGKYDIAAINFAYAEHVEQWKEETKLPNLLSNSTFISDYKELPRIFAGGTGSGPALDPETQKKGIDIIVNDRTWVPISSAKELRRQGIISNSKNWANNQFNPSKEPYIDRAVEYSFCTDDQNGNTLNCAIYDFGANQKEVVNHAFDTYRAFQPFWRHKRHSISRGWENYNNYIGRVQSTLETVDTPFRYFSIYRWYNLGNFTDDLRDAAIDALNFYGELMAMPEPGTYCNYGTSTDGIDSGWYYDLRDVYVPADWDRQGGNCAGKITIGADDGQYYGFKFTDEYEYRVERVGTYIDKSIAAQMMFDISADFAGSTFFTDFRATSISYWTLFRKEYLQMIRGILLGDYHGFGGVIDHLGKYTPPMIVDKADFGRGKPNPQLGMKRIYTPVSFNHQFSMLVGGMISASGWEDRQIDFAQYVKVGVNASEMQEFPAGWDLATFEHPISGQIYTAPQTADGESITYDMIGWANDLKVEYLDAKAKRDAETPGTNEWRKKNDELILRSEQMEDVVAKLDMIRYVWAALGAQALH